MTGSAGWEEYELCRDPERRVSEYVSMGYVLGIARCWGEEDATWRTLHAGGRAASMNEAKHFVEALHNFRKRYIVFPRGSG